RARRGAERVPPLRVGEGGDAGPRDHDLDAGERLPAPRGRHLAGHGPRLLGGGGRCREEQRGRQCGPHAASPAWRGCHAAPPVRRWTEGERLDGSGRSGKAEGGASTRERVGCCGHGPEPDCSVLNGSVTCAWSTEARWEGGVAAQRGGRLRGVLTRS